MNDDRVYRHTEEAPTTGSGGDPELLEAVTAHVQQHIGEVEHVFHQLVSLWVHVDILVVPPTEDRPCYTLVTSGMAEKPMAAPDDDPALAYTELVLALPPDWPLDSPEGNWPLKLMQDLAELPHRFETWLYCGHTVPNGDPAEPYARGVGFTGVVLATPLLVPDEFDVVRAGDREVRFQSVIPLYTDEMDFKLAQGADALFDRLGDAGVSEGLDVGRPSVVGGAAKRRRFGFRRR